MADIDIFSLKPPEISRSLKGKYMLIYGAPKIGKTSFACQCDRALVCAFELGTNAIPNQTIRVQPIQKWLDFKNPEQENGNKYFALVPQYVFLRTKLIFDPPPPSNVQFYNEMIKEILWRLKRAYGEVQNA